MDGTDFVLPVSCLVHSEHPSMDCSEHCPPGTSRSIPLDTMVHMMVVQTLCYSESLTLSRLVHIVPTKQCVAAGITKECTHGMVQALWYPVQ